MPARNATVGPISLSRSSGVVAADDADRDDENRAGHRHDGLAQPARARDRNHEAQHQDRDRDALRERARHAGEATQLACLG